MKLISVSIRGFRSIENMNLSLEESGHKILVGKNESGKSNILHALYLISNNRKFEAKDKKVLFRDKCSVSFRFNLEQDELSKVRDNFYNKFSGNPQRSLAGNLSVEQFTEFCSKYIYYQINSEGEKSWKFIPCPTSPRINSGWHRLTQDLSSDSPDVAEKFRAGNYVNEGEIKDPRLIKPLNTSGMFSKITLNEIYGDLISIIKQFSISDDNYVFPVIFWEYSASEHDLPPTVDRDSFSQKPDSCIPLKSMFLLAGIEENQINSKISEATGLGRNHLQNLFDDISQETNKYVNKTWKEYKHVKIELRSDGSEIVIAIKDSKNSFDFQQRSDGYRRFISFLLLINTEINKTQGHNPLILIDEPETGLHPSSAKYLKGKLIELGQDNLVVYATHSISMIDSENIENNLIVTRNGENTTIETVKEDGTSPAENIYQAIGYSIYENLKQKKHFVGRIHG